MFVFPGAAESSVPNGSLRCLGGIQGTVERERWGKRVELEVRGASTWH